jgi:hypothetical protein
LTAERDGNTAIAMAPRLLLAGLAILAAGCGGGGSEAGQEKDKLSPEAQEALDELDANTSEPDPAADIEQLLGERAQALAAEDGDALSATADGRQRARDRVTARRAKRLQIERVRIVADELETDGGRGEALVTMSYRVRGMRRPFYTRRELVLRKRSVGWRVSRDKPRAESLPWEVAAFEVTRAPHVILLADPSVDPAPLRAGLVRAYREIRRNLPARDLPRDVLVIAARDDAQAERLTGRIARGVIALANVRVDFGPEPTLEVERVLEQRLIVLDSRWRALPPEEQQSTLVHEMTHTALNPDTSGRTPPWLIEGVAMYVSGDDRTEEARLRAAGAGPTTTLRKLCKPNSIFRLSGSAQGAAYAWSSGAAQAIVDQSGTEGLFRLYDAFNDDKYDGRTCAATTDRVMRRTIDMSLARLEAAVTGG